MLAVSPPSPPRPPPITGESSGSLKAEDPLVRSPSPLPPVVSLKSAGSGFAVAEGLTPPRHLLCAVRAGAGGHGAVQVVVTCRCVELESSSKEGRVTANRENGMGLGDWVTDTEGGT